MSSVFLDTLTAGGLDYAIDTYPLEPRLALLPERPPLRMTPFSLHGYWATWSVDAGMLYLVKVTGDLWARLFPQARGPVPATWFSGYIRGMRGVHRHTGYPPRKFFEDEIVLEVVAGRVVRAWVLDLRAVPDQTDAEFRLSVPRFLWPKHWQDLPDEDGGGS